MLALLPDAVHKAFDRIFWKRIKRSRRKENDESESDDDESSSDDDEEEEEEDEYADDGEPEVCPPGVAEESFLAVLELRELRLDQDDALNDFKKTAEALKKEFDTLVTREAAVDDALKKVEKETQQFQHEKQRQLNLLETIVVLKLSQIQCLTADRKMPRVITDDIVVFTQEGLRRLRQRIVDLDTEKQGLREESHLLAQENQRLSRRKTKRLAEYTQLENKVFEVQLLKFGQKVNLEMLENVAVDRETEELKAQLKAEELKWERDLAKQVNAQNALVRQQQYRIAENTSQLKELSSMRSEQRDLELALTQSQAKIVAKMTGGSKVATAADRAHLKDLVVAQQQEIDALKNEIAMLRRKGGHVYTPVVNKVAPPM
jgi:hypothetical protein